MGIASRIHSTIEDWILDWRDRLRGWMISWVVGGMTDALEELNPDQKTTLQDNLQDLIDNPDTPPHIRDFLKHATERGNPLVILVAVLIIPLMLIPMITGAFQPLGNLWNYAQERVFKSFRIDPLAIITAWRRDPEKYAFLLDDLKDEGWSDERIEALKFFTLFIPAAQDQINWLAKEVFEPDMYERYGLKDELPIYENTDFSKIGVDPKQMTNYWMAHWEHASFMQVIEMLHRGTLSLDKKMPAPPTTKEGWAARDAEGEKALYDWYRLVEIPPFWRDRLTAMSWNVPTRVDVRRWWDMRTISEEELRNIYHRQGYHGTDLDNYVLWTKVYVAFPTLLARWTNGWITEDDVKNELTKLGMPSDRVNEMIQEKKKAVEAGQVEEGKALTKAEIYKGVKAGTLTRDEGIELIMDLNYTLAQAEYLLDINVATLTGSPETFAEFKDLTTKYRLATGREEKPMPEEIKQAAAEVVRLTAEVKALESSIKEEKAKLIPSDTLPPEATARLEKLQVDRNRAISALELAKSEYNSRVAEWKHESQK